MNRRNAGGARVSKAAIYLGLAALVTQGAQVVAADLLPPAPSLDSPALRGRFAADSGAYVRADAGFGSLQTRSAASTFSAPTPGFQYDAAQAGRASMLGFGAGYRFNEYVRLDMTGEYRGAASYSASTSYVDANACGAARCKDAYSGSIKGAALMGNVYGEIGSWFDVTPFIGFGAGFAQTTLAPMTMPAANGHTAGEAPRASQVRPSFAVMAGASWDLSSKLKVEAGYRYMTLGTARSGAMACAPGAGPCAAQVQQIGLASHDLRIGLRYGLSEGVF